MKKFVLIFLGIIAAVGIYTYARKSPLTNLSTDMANSADNEMGAIDINPLTIDVLKKGNYPGSPLVTEETLVPGSNYTRSIVSYQSEGLKIRALLTIPKTEKPQGGFPVIIFNHGYIPPAEYRTTERYIAYVDGFARNGYIVLRSDYRGHDQSEGNPSGAYGSNGYTIDVLNAVASVKRHADVNPAKIGMWGHSMGGYITLRNMVANKDVKAGVIWAGVVASYPDLLNNWRRNGPTRVQPTGSRSWRVMLAQQYGTPEKNPEFWNSISANSYLADISGPLQLHHGTADESVPVEFSEKLERQMKTAGKTVELYTYQGDDHNLEGNFNTAMDRSIKFFDTYLK